MIGQVSLAGEFSIAYGTTVFDSGVHMGVPKMAHGSSRGRIGSPAFWACMPLVRVLHYDVVCKKVGRL